MFSGGAITHTKKKAGVAKSRAPAGTLSMDETLRQSSKALRKYVKTSMPDTVNLSTTRRRKSVKGGSGSHAGDSSERESARRASARRGLPKIAKQIMVDISNKMADINKTEYHIQTLLDDPVKLGSLVDVQTTMADAYKTLQNTSGTLQSLLSMVRVMYKYRLFHRDSDSHQTETDETYGEITVRSPIDDLSVSAPAPVEVPVAHQHIDAVVVEISSNSVSAPEQSIIIRPETPPVKLGGTIHVTGCDDTDSVSVVLGGVLNMTNIYGGAG